MKIIYVILIFLIICVLGCDRKIEHPELIKMLRSDNAAQIVEATTYISDHRDTSMIKEMLKQSFDPRITHVLHHYGMSVYQIKMGSMRELTNLVSPHKITHKPDSVNVEFYLSVAIKRGWIKNLD